MNQGTMAAVNFMPHKPEIRHEEVAYDWLAFDYPALNLL